MTNRCAARAATRLRPKVARVRPRAPAHASTSRAHAREAITRRTADLGGAVRRWRAGSGGRGAGGGPGATGRCAASGRPQRRPGRPARVPTGREQRGRVEPCSRRQRVDVGRVVAQRLQDGGGDGRSVESSGTPAAVDARRALPATSSSSSSTSCARLDELGAMRISAVATFGERRVDGTGNREHLAPLLGRHPRGDQRAEPSAASTTSTPRASPLIRRLRRGKWCCRAGVPGGTRRGSGRPSRARARGRDCAAG